VGHPVYSTIGRIYTSVTGTHCPVSRAR